MIIAIAIGFVLGALGSIPVAGPIGALVISRGIAGRRRAAVAIALGGGLVEAAYALMAFWGFSTFLVQYPFIEPASRALAALMLGGLGGLFLMGKAEVQPCERSERDSTFGSFMLGASLSAINPTQIAAWTAVVTTLYGAGLLMFDQSLAAPFAVGVMAGISSWFLGLLWLIERYKERFTPAAVSRFVRGIGLVLMVMACWFAARFANYLLNT